MKRNRISYKETSNRQTPNSVSRRWIKIKTSLKEIIKQNRNLIKIVKVNDFIDKQLVHYRLVLLLQIRKKKNLNILH
jgi:acetolactate synthase small subunit